MNSRKRYPPLFEIKLSENCTVTPIVSWKLMHERRLQREKERLATQKLLDEIPEVHSK